MKKPKLCVNKSGIYYIYVNRKRVYLGKCDEKTAVIRYNALMQKTLDPLSHLSSSPGDIMLVELAARFMVSHKGYYKRSSEGFDKQLHRFHIALSFPLALFAELPAAQFGAKKLIETRDAMVASNRFTRGYINTLINCIRRVFSWGVEQELVTPACLTALRAVSPLKRGRSEAKESSPVISVDPATVAATLKCLSPVVAAVVTLQSLTGLRPSEALNIRVRDLKKRQDGLVELTLEHDKTDYRREISDRRVVLLGARAAAICRQFSANKSPAAYLFESSPDTPYKPSSYARAISRAAKRAGVDHWSPYQLRHLYATQVRARFGLEAAQIALGHKNASVTQIYAERDAKLAQKIAVEMG